MSELPSQTRLQVLLRREARSFLQYVRQANPWAGPRDAPALEKVLAMGDAERAALEELGAFMLSRHIPLPYFGAYPMPFTSYNYVSVRALLPRLIQEQRRAIDLLAQDRASPQDGEIAAMVGKLIELKQRHLAEMEELSAPAPETAGG